MISNNSDNPVNAGEAWAAAMRRGDDKAAWAVNDAVLAARDPAAADDPRLPYHQRWVWDGRPLANEHVLVRCYHGLGDTLQYARFLRALGAIAASVMVEAQAALLPLLETVPGIDRLMPFVLDAPIRRAGPAIEIMELPHALRLAAGSCPPPYMRPPSVVPRPGVIGICWQAGEWDRSRSIDEALLAPLAEARLALALQPRPTALTVLNPGGTGELTSVAADIAGLDLVITVDTMVAHLAGALDRPTWLLLKHDADWRWMDRRSDSPWYPRMRLYRQSSAGDWTAVLAAVEADLRALASRETGGAERHGASSTLTLGPR